MRLGTFLAPAALLGAALVAALMGRVAFAALFLVLAIAAAAVIGSFGAQRRRATVDADLAPEERALVRPIRKLYEDIEEIVRTHRKSTVVQVIGAEALGEARRILEQSVRSVDLRSELKKTMRGEYEAKRATKELEQRLASATSDEERQSLEGAIQARNTELGHYGSVESTIARIDSGLRQAEAALAEMKARLNVSASGEKAEQGSDQDLRETVARMKALSLSYDEAEQLLRE